jgi:hypothetical protein
VDIPLLLILDGLRTFPLVAVLDQSLCLDISVDFMVGFLVCIFSR